MTTGRRFLILSAGMGSGHDAVASALTARLEDAGHEAVRADVLELLPAGIGHGIRAGYRTVIERVPLLYAGIYQVFFRGGSAVRPGSAPLAALAENGLLELVRRREADVIVSVFHLAAQITGRLRARGALPVPSAVLLTEFEAHRQWLHPGNDLYLCHTEEIAAGIRHGIGCPASAYGPVVDARFTCAGPGEFPDAAERWRLAPDGRPVALLSTGAWGIGSSLVRTAGLLHRDGYAPAVLCGTNDRLRGRLSAALDGARGGALDRARGGALGGAGQGATALGWVEDMPALMRVASVLVDNAAGQTAMEALAAGLPVIGYRPIPGHGADGVRLMARLRLSDYARDPGELRGSMRALARAGEERERRVAAGRAVFRPGVVSALANLR